MRLRRSRTTAPLPPAPDRWPPLSGLCLELGRAVALQEAAERVILGCAGPWPVDGTHSAQGSPVVTELLRISNRIGDLTVAEKDAELKEDACYLVLYHQAAVDRALRLAYTPDVCETSERERTSLVGLGAPGEQLRRLHLEILDLLRTSGPDATAAPRPSVTAVQSSVATAGPRA